MSKIHFYNTPIFLPSLTELLTISNRFVADSLFDLYKSHEVGHERIKCSYKDRLPCLLSEKLVESANFHLMGTLGPDDIYNELRAAFDVTSDLNDPQAPPIAGYFYTSLYYIEKGSKKSKSKQYSSIEGRVENEAVTLFLTHTLKSKFIIGELPVIVSLIEKIQEASGVFKDKTMEEHLGTLKTMGIISTVLPRSTRSDVLIEIQKNIIVYWRIKSFMLSGMWQILILNIRGKIQFWIIIRYMPEVSRRKHSILTWSITS